MRVAYVVHSFGMGGLERCVAHLLNHLDRSRFRPLLICLNRSGDAATWIKAADVPIIELHKRAGNDPRLVYRLAVALRRHRVDLVHSQNWCTLVETALARRLAGVQLHLHGQQGYDRGFLNLNGLTGRLRAEIMRWAILQANAVVAVADALRDFLSRTCHFPGHRIHVIHNGVELPPVEGRELERQRLRKRLGLPEGAVLVGSVGRLAEVKGFEVAIDAVALLAGSGHNAHLVLVGDGQEREKLAARARAAGVAHRVHLVGQQDNVSAWLAAMDVFINSSHSEGMSLSVLEGMSAGLPLVVTDVGANASLADGNPPCGLVVPPRDPGAFADALAKMISDPELRFNFGARARAHAARYSVQHTARVYEKLYWSLRT